ALFRDGPELLQGRGFDLADTLAREVERLADLFEGLTGTSVHPEPELQELLLARREVIEQGARLHLHAALGELLVGSRRAHVGHAIAELTAVARVAEGSLETERLADQAADGADLVDRKAALARQLFVAGIANALLGHGPLDPLELVTALEEVDGHPDGLALVGQRARHGLAN